MYKNNTKTSTHLIKSECIPDDHFSILDYKNQNYLHILKVNDSVVELRWRNITLAMYVQ